MPSRHTSSFSGIPAYVKTQRQNELAVGLLCMITVPVNEDTHTIIQKH